MEHEGPDSPLIHTSLIEVSSVTPLTGEALAMELHRYEMAVSEREIRLTM